jgi:hypothetical protein
MVHSPDRKFVLSTDCGMMVYSYEYNPNSATVVLKVKTVLL